MTRITIFAIIISRYPNDKKELLGFVNMTMGVMKAFGPVLGGLLFSLFGFENTNFIFAAMIGVLGTVSVATLPSIVNSEL
jgi:MFS family permease